MNQPKLNSATLIPRRAGFTLLELAVVLGIISLIVGAGITMSTGALKAADRVTTEERLATIKLALDSYAKTYGYLPCPFDRSLRATSANFGVERRSATTCTANAPGIVQVTSGVDIIWFGGVPVRTLGLPDNYAGDAWGNKFTYAVADVAKTNPSSYATQNGVITIKTGDRTTNYDISSKRTTMFFTNVTNNGAGAPRVEVADTGTLTAGTIVHINGDFYNGSFTVAPASVTATTFDLVGVTYTSPDDGTVEWLEPGAAATYAVISHGPDGRGAFPVNATAIPGTKLCVGVGAGTSPPPCSSSSTTTCIDIENCNNDATLFDTAYNDGGQAALYYDDYIVWGSNAGARTAVNNGLYTACSGTCEPWCATCTVNYPGGGAIAPPVAITSGAVLCKKTVTSNATLCTASCFWGGTTAAGYIKCP